MTINDVVAAMPRSIMLSEVQVISDESGDCVSVVEIMDSH